MTIDYVRGMIDALDIQPKTLASVAGMDQSNLSRILNKHKPVRDQQISQILQAVGVIRARETKKEELVPAGRR